MSAEYLLVSHLNTFDKYEIDSCDPGLIELTVHIPFHICPFKINNTGNENLCSCLSDEIV